MKLKKGALLTAILVCLFCLCLSESAFALSPDSDFGYGAIGGVRLVAGGYQKTEIVEDPIDKNGKCISLSSTSETGTEARIEYEFTESNTGYYPEGKFSVEMSVFFPELINAGMQLYGHKTADGSNAESFHVRFCSDGSMVTGDRELSCSYEAGKWYKIKLLADTDSQTVKILFGSEDNYEIATVKNSPSLMSFKMFNAPKDCYRFRFTIGKNQNGKKVYLKNVSIRSQSGLSDVADVKSFSLFSNGEEADGLSETNENITVKADIRKNPSKVCLFAAALYDSNNTLKSADAVFAEQTGTFEVSLGNVNTEGMHLRCYVWEAQSIAPVGSRVFAGSSISAADYGVIPNTGEDMTENIQNAIEMLSSGATLTFDEGEYIVSPKVGEKYCLDLTGENDVVINGGGAKFLLSDSFSGFMRINGGSRITVKNLAVDYINKPWEQGTVINTVKAASDEEKSYFDMELSENSGFFNTELFKNNVSACFLTVRDDADPTLQNKKSNEHYLVCGVLPLGENVYRFYVSDWSEYMIFSGGMEAGDKVIVNLRNMSGSALNIGGASDVEINNVTVYASGECGIKAAYMGGDLTLDGFRMLISEGRWICSNADGVHFQFSRGKFIAKNCVFEGLSDDCINLYQIPLSVASADNGTLAFCGAAQRPKAGDLLTVINSNTGRVKYRGAEVINTTSEGVTLNGDYTEIGPGDSVFIENGMFGYSEITNNKFLNSRRYGLIIRAENILVEGNEFRNLGNDAVASHCTSGEGMALTNAQFRRNTISDCGYLRNGKQETSGAFSIRNVLSGGDDINIHQNLVFSGNIIKNSESCGFYINSADGVTIERSNVIEGLADGKYGINISQCKNVNVEEGIEMSYKNSQERVKTLINAVEN